MSQLGRKQGISTITTDTKPIHALIRQVRKGEAASYGMIASLLPGVGPRMVARAMRSAPDNLPWYRIVTASGAPADHSGAVRQIELLRKEGVVIKKNGAVDWSQCRWGGPTQKWLDRSGREIEEVMEIIAGWKR